MSWFAAKIYDRFMAGAEEACLSAWRSELLTHASGRVLEVGAGTGANLAYYGEGVTHLHATEPDVHMRAQLEAKRGPRALEITDDAAATLRVGDATYDTVVATLVLCSAEDPLAALRDIHRVLKPGGMYLFLEHVAADRGTSRRRWQGIVEPVWKRVAGNCHVTRETERAIREVGFEIEQLDRGSMRKAPPWVRPTIRGIARRV
jgi:ubiquinone/menaquinone biosynthesis C-methylase UbiE